MEKIKFLDLKKINQNYLKNCQKSILSQMYSGDYILDNNVVKFEKEFSKFNNAKYCVGVNSGHDALKLSLAALNIKKNDSIIVPSMTFISTYFAISEFGGIPYPVDINEYGVIDVKKLPKRLSKRIKGMIAVNLYGNLCDYNLLKKYCKKNSIFLLEDSSQSHGAFFFKNKKKKLWGDIATFSFYPGKNLGSITDGGAVITNNRSLFEKIKSLRNYGSKIKYYHDDLGFNSRLNSTSAIFLCQKLKKLNFENTLRSKQEKKYINELKDITQLSFLKRNIKAVSSHHLFLVFLKDRDKLKDFLNKNKIETSIHYPVAPVNQKYYEKILKVKKKYPIASKFEKETLSLPLGKHLSNKQQDFIISTIKKFFMKS